MGPIILTAVILVALTVLVHGLGFALLLKYWMRLDGFPKRKWAIFRLLTATALFLVFLHATEITIWACAYLWQGCLPDAESAFYFSGTTYTTIGFGDIVLEKPWRLLAPLEGVTGVIMSGVSSALFFVLLQRVHLNRSGGKSKNASDARVQ